MSDTQPTNRLSRESSPYLLQHQHNPVDWYPWGPEAFERAAAEDKAIFLSVGYSTCYWCHVMERESFENPAVAAEMNRRFVCIKVDREERPDVDQLYMTAVQILTRHGGWPMSVFLTPDRRPFYGGTYFPPQDSARGMGFVSLMEQVDQAWRQRRADVEKSAGEIADILGRLAVPPNVEGRLELDEAFVHSLIERSVSDFDEETGGFGGAPKFPRQTLLMLILAYLDDPQSVGPGDSELKTRLRAMMTRTLDAMADGGIRDQLGGGFHRYSTDAHWIVPHFEIMLYDNALLAWIYAEAHRQTGQPSYAAVARGVLDFILREMTSDDGVFYTAFDAEVDGREGQSYLWTPDEVKRVLGEAGWDEQGVKMFLDAYNLDAQPNFADPHHGTGQPDHWVLHRTGPMEAVAKLWNRSLEALEEALSHMRQDLLAARRKREQPSLDRKILTSWNALMIRALTHGGMALKEPRYLDAAARAADWLRRHHMTSDGVLLHASRPDRPGRQVPGFLEDYAGLALALMELDRAEERGQSDRDEWITQLLDAMDERFGDAAGGFYFTDVKADDLIVRQKVGYDSPLPSGNGLAAMALQMAGRHEAADRILEVFAQSMHRQGEGMSTLVEAALRRVAGAGPMTVEGEARSIPAAPPPREPVSLWAQWLSPTRLAVTARIAHGFHLNAHDAPAGLIGTRLAIGSPYDTWIRAIDYPPGEEQAYAFHDRPLKVYTGQVTFTLDFRAVPDVSAQPLSLVLHYQPCTDNACQRPARQILEVSGR